MCEGNDHSGEPVVFGWGGLSAEDIAELQENARLGRPPILSSDPWYIKHPGRYFALSLAAAAVLALGLSQFLGKEKIVDDFMEDVAGRVEACMRDKEVPMEDLCAGRITSRQFLVVNDCMEKHFKNPEELDTSTLVRRSLGRVVENNCPE
ncbi:hypothetical protein HN709_02560 [Candidatus Peregrinibacteria bacterium]|jgi:hypothetical protein|nr:hypothetical protein [Candidatus Peregrinibacteria bacterium]MBT7736545.1 hypothetical protein [Candidatus Peregrinibacteria bacterium]